MSRTRSKHSPGLLRIWFARVGRLIDALLPRSPGWILALFALGGIAIGGYQAWRYVVPWVSQSTHYQVEPGDIVISQTPPWIRSDIKKKVILDASLDGTMSILDDDLQKRLWKAFEFHPWVKEVRRVELSAGPRVDIELIYRQPVAIVQVKDRKASDSEYIPVDLDGRRLPSEDITLAERKQFPLITGMQGLPLEGEAWNDPRVVGAARLAALLAEDWHKLELREIRPHERDYNPKHSLQQVLEKTEYLLGRKRGPPIIWGLAPELNLPGEPPDSAKVAQLKLIVDQSERFGGPQAIDLRRELAIERTARQPSKPAPNSLK